MVALNDEPEVQFRRKSDPSPNPPTRPHPGFAQGSAEASIEDKPLKFSPTLLFLFSIVIPGLGQIFLGFFFQAILFFICAIGCWYMLYAFGADMYWPIIIAHFGSAISAWLAGKAREI